MLYFDNEDNDWLYPKAFIKDLQKDMEPWQEQGDQIILILDAKNDSCTGEVHTALHSIFLEESIMEQHGDEVPQMCNKGTNPINGIFTPLLCRLCMGDICLLTNISHWTTGCYG